MTAKLHYDGHGINDATGRRLFTRQRTHADQGGGYTTTDAEAQALGTMFETAPSMLAALEMIHEHLSHGDNVPAILQTLAAVAIAKAKGQP